jgi:hypothetical protein
MSDGGRSTGLFGFFGFFFLATRKPRLSKCYPGGSTERERLPFFETVDRNDVDMDVQSLTRPGPIRPGPRRRPATRRITL